MDWERKQFIQFLEETLIPDLWRSKTFGLVEDFMTAVYFMKNNSDYYIDPIGDWEDEELNDLFGDDEY